MNTTSTTARLIVTAIVAAKIVDAARSPIGSLVLRTVFGLEV